MYSMGVLFFEMVTFFKSYSERGQVLEKLNQNPDKILPEFIEDSNQKQIAIVRLLVDHDPDKRPSATELLTSDLIPQPMEQEKLDRQLGYIAKNHPDRFNAMLTKINNSDAWDLGWDAAATDFAPNLSPLVLDNVRKGLCRIFKKHGAVESNRQPLIPKMQHSNKDALIVYNANGMNFQLIQDVTTPFARVIGTTIPQFSKYYSFDSSYQIREQYGQNAEPQQTLEANFDFVSSKLSDPALKEASTIYLTKEIVQEFPVLAHGEWVIMINHLDLLDIILDACNIQPADQIEVKILLESLFYGSQSKATRKNVWKHYESEMRQTLNIDATAIAFLGRFAFLSGSPENVRVLLEQKLGKQNPAFSRALVPLRRLEETVAYLERLKLGMPIKITPLFSFRARLYDGAMIYQCFEKSTGLVLAEGGRYDKLVEHHHRLSETPLVRAVGLRVRLDNLVAATTTLAAAATSTKKPAASASPSAALSRCSVLVTSFSPELLTTSCLDVLQQIWAAGVSAELAEGVESMEQLEAMRADNGAFWLVIVRMGGLEGSMLLKVRSPSGGEEAVGEEEVGEYLRVEVAREEKKRG